MKTKTIHFVLIAIIFLSIGVILSTTLVHAQRVYFPNDVMGFANTDKEVVIIKITKNMSVAEFMTIALHEFGHFQYYYMSPEQKYEVRRWYNNLNEYHWFNYSQICKKCIPHEEEFAEYYREHFAFTNTSIHFWGQTQTIPNLLHQELYTKKPYTYTLNETIKWR